jgi:hypothetical protein
MLRMRVLAISQEVRQPVIPMLLRNLKHHAENTHHLVAVIQKNLEHLLSHQTVTGIRDHAQHAQLAQARWRKQLQLTKILSEIINDLLNLLIDGLEQAVITVEMPALNIPMEPLRLNQKRILRGKSTPQAQVILLVIVHNENLSTSDKIAVPRRGLAQLAPVSPAGFTHVGLAEIGVTQ